MERSEQTSALPNNGNDDSQIKKELPLRLNHGDGPEIHRKLAIEYGVANKLCTDCGKIGNLTCFSPSFRKWALRRVSEEELEESNQTCSRCMRRGHVCVDCDAPITTDETNGKKIQRCGVCRAVGHNRRSCFRAD